MRMKAPTGMRIPIDLSTFFGGGDGLQKRQPDMDRLVVDFADGVFLRFFSISVAVISEKMTLAPSAAYQR